MAHRGDELVDPVRGQRLVFRKTAKETEGQLVEVESFLKPGSSAPPEHFHPLQEERFEVVAGTIRAHIGGREHTYGAGEAFVIPAGTVHEMANGGNDEARFIWQTLPALKTEAFFETLWGLARDGKTNKNGVPNLLQAAVLAREYEHEFCLAQPPLVVQKIVFGILAPLGRLFGYRGSYPQYSRSE